MSNLMGMVYTGVSGIFASQVGLDTVGHNIANMKNENYSRQNVSYVSNKPQYTTVGSMGRGVKVEGITRSYDELLAKNVRNELSSYSYYSSLQTSLKEAMLYFNELEQGSGMGDPLKAYFNAWQDLANSAPDNTGEAEVKRITLVSAAQTLTQQIREGYDSIESARAAADTTIQNGVNSINQIVENISALNKEIAKTEGAGDHANDLRDSRDALVDQLAKLTNVVTYERENGQITVMISGQAIVDGSSFHRLEAKPDPSNDGHLNVYWKTNNQNSKPVDITSALNGGSLAAAVKSRDEILKSYLTDLDVMAQSVIESTNRLHASGQGLERFSEITSLNGPDNPKYPLSSSLGGLPYEVKEGTFRISLHRDAVGDLPENDFTIDVNIDPDTDNLMSVIDKINRSGGGAVKAYLSENNTLKITASNGYSLTFEDDTSDFLMAAGLNAFFTGTSARDIEVNPLIAENPDYIASGKKGAVGDNANAKAIADLALQPTLNEGKTTLGDFYGYFIGRMGTDKNQTDVFAATKKMSYNQVNTRLASVRGVTEQEELINMSLFQRTFEANSRFVNTVDEMLNTLINGLGAGR